MRNKKGEGYVSTCVMIVIICMLLSIFITFILTVGIVKQVRRNSRVVLDNYVMEKSIEIYDSIKTSDSSNVAIDNERYIELLCHYCTFHKSTQMIYNYGENKEVLYYLSEPELGFEEYNKLKIYVRYNLYIPIYFSGIHIDTVTVPIKISSIYRDKF